MSVNDIPREFRRFFDELNGNLKDAGIDVDGMVVSHVCFRTASLPEYFATRDELRLIARAIAEDDFRGRPISMILLKEPLRLSERHNVELIELPAPRGAHTYPSGLEHVGFVVGPGLADFARSFGGVLTGTKQREPNYEIPFITFANGTTAKFYERPLLEIVLDDGWKFEPQVPR